MIVLENQCALEIVDPEIVDPEIVNPEIVNPESLNPEIRVLSDVG